MNYLIEKEHHVPTISAIKIGGCLTTYKDEYKSVNLSYLNSIGDVLAGLIEDKHLDVHSLILVLGGGSFGNAIPKSFNLSPWTDKTKQEDICLMSLGQIELAAAVIAILREKAIPTQLFHLPSLIMHHHTDVSGAAHYAVNCFPIVSSLAVGLVPVITGDLIVMPPRNSKVLSSDVVPHLIANEIQLTEVIYLTNTRGVLEGDSKDALTREVIRLEDKSRVHEWIWSPGEFDFTGGMGLKIKHCLDLAQSGTPSYIIDGRDPQSLRDLIANGEVHGTKIVK